MMVSKWDVSSSSFFVQKVMLYLEYFILADIFMIVIVVVRVRARTHMFGL